MAVAVALNIGWVVVNWRTGLMLVGGVLSFAVLIAGLALNMIFLLREIRRNEQHNAFINAVTHELKTPVASIRLFLQTLQSREVDPEKRQEFYQSMLEDSERLQATIDQVLLAGKTGSGGRALNRAPLDIAELVEECVALADKRGRLPADALRFSNRVPEGEQLIVSGDLEEIKAAVTNLIENAIKYSGDRVRVLVEVAKSGARRVSIQVRDEGIGISNDELKRVFRRFYRIPGKSPRVKGAGLGLSIVSAVARRHGGRAYVESEGAGRGSRFTLELPLLLK